MVTVLYLEDKEIVRENAISFLTLIGHTVKGASNGQQGLEVLAGEDIMGIIFTDMNMPVMGGYDFSKAVKTDPRYAKHSKVPIVGVGNFPDSMQEYLVESIHKPFNHESLLRCIDQYCK